MTPARTCARCGTTPDHVEFAREKRAPDGLASYCRPCSRERKREQYAKSTEAHNARTRAYYEANKAAVLAQQEQYRAENADRISAYDRERQHRSERIEQRQARRVAHRDEINARQREWWRNHPSELVRRFAQVRLRRHGFADLADSAELVDVDALYARYDGLCAICGEPLAREDLTIDHIKPVSLGGPHVESNCQPAHLACNQSKGRRDDSWPSLTSSADAI